MTWKFRRAPDVNGAMAIRPIRFAREKYGRTCLGDAGEVAALPGFIDHPQPHALAFYELMIVREGSGDLRLDEAAYPVRPLAAFVTRPGQVRSWRLAGRLRAEVVFFEREWMSAAADALDLREGAIALPASALAALEQVSRELRRGDDPRPAVARVLQLLPAAALPRALVRRYLQRVEQDFLGRVADHARALGVTPEHLTRSVRAETGRSAGKILHGRLLLEAQRALRYGDEPIAAIAERLRFCDASYFGRFFRRATGSTPARYRADAR